MIYKNSEKQSVVMESTSEPIISTLNMEPHRKKRKGNWRLDILSAPKVRTPKYVEPEYKFDSGVRPEALRAAPKERDDQISIPVLRKLYINKREYAGHPNTLKNYAQNMDKQINKAWNSIYYEYKKARRDKKLRLLERLAQKQKHKKHKEKLGKSKSGKTKKGSERKLGKKGKDDDAASIKSEDPEKQFQEWASKRALPKQVPKPEPINRGPIADLDAMKERLDSLSAPPHPREKYVENPPPKQLVNEAALTYEPTERILELAKLPPFRLIKEDEIVLGSVKPGALKYISTERNTQLATPRARANAHDADLKEDPFTISKNALKYKATPRIIELAKPKERK